MNKYLLVLLSASIIFCHVKNNIAKSINNNYALLFNGEKNIYAHVQNHYELNLTDSLTIEAWINPADWGKIENESISYILHKGTFQVLLCGDNHPKFNKYCLVFCLQNNDFENFYVYTSDNSISLNKWCHIAITYHKKIGAKIYLNGENQQLAYEGGNPVGQIGNNMGYPVFLGNGVPFEYTLTGAIDEFRLWNIHRSQSQIKDNMIFTEDEKQKSLVLYWKFNEGSGEFSKDYSQNSFSCNVHCEWTNGFCVDSTTAIEHQIITQSQQFSLDQNYPNPFNPTTTINYNLQKSSNVILKIYNLVGREIETLVNEFQKAGEKQVQWTAEKLSSGIYFYRLQAGEFSETRKLILQK